MAVAEATGPLVAAKRKRRSAGQDKQTGPHFSGIQRAKHLLLEMLGIEAVVVVFLPFQEERPLRGERLELRTGPSLRRPPGDRDRNDSFWEYPDAGIVRR